MDSGNDKLKILIPDLIIPPADVEQGVFKDMAEVTAAQARKATEIADDQWENCDAVLAYDKLTYDPALLAKLKKCKVISRAGIGYDNVDLAAAKRHKIVVCNIPDYCIEEVADHTLALLLSLVRGITEHDRKVRQKVWERESPITFRLRDKVFAIIGLGRIGTAVASRAKAFGLKVIAFDPYIREETFAQLGVARAGTLQELCQAADIISLHTPLTDETTEIVNDDFFKNTRQGVVLINTARGGLINLKALERAMQSNVVMACGLDVLPVEPLDDTNQFLADYANNAEWLRGRLLITPHVAFYSQEACTELKKKSAEEAKRVLKGQKPNNCVNDYYVDE